MMHGFILAAVATCLAQAAPEVSPAEVKFENQPVAYWMEQLNDDDFNIRRRAAYVLGRIAPAAKEAIPALTGALQDRHMETRWYAIDALGSFGPAAKNAVPSIIASLREKQNDETVRRRGARSLGRIGPAAGDAVPVLAEALTSDDALYRVAAAEALWRINRHPRALRTLAEALGQGETDSAFAAAMALASLGSADSSAVRKSAGDELVSALGHADTDVRRAAALAMATLQLDGVELLCTALESSNVHHEDAATGLGLTVDKLRKPILYGNNATAFVTAARPLVSRAVPALIAALGDHREEVRQASASALAKLGLLSLPGLLEALATGDAASRNAAAMAILRAEKYLPADANLPPHLARVKSKALPPLLKALESDDAGVRRAAVRLLATLNFGVQAKAAVPLLQKALASEDVVARRYADQALKQINAAP